MSIGAQWGHASEEGLYMFSTMTNPSRSRAKDPVQTIQGCPNSLDLEGLGDHLQFSHPAVGQKNNTTTKIYKISSLRELQI